MKKLNMIHLILFIAVISHNTLAGVSEIKNIWDSGAEIYPTRFLRAIDKPVIIESTLLITNVIPVPEILQTLSTVYIDLMGKYFGEGSHLNQDITYNTVSMYFLSMDSTNSVAAADGTKVKEIFGHMVSSGLTAHPNEVWTFPYAMEAVTNVQSIVTQEYTPSIMERNGVNWTTTREMFDAFNSISE